MTRRVSLLLLLVGSISTASIIPTVGSRAAGSDASGACQPHKIDLGNGKSVTGGCDPLRIAFLMGCSNNVYCQAVIKGATDTAAKLGANIEVFDSNWNPTTQFNQAQDVISSGKFNAIYAQTINGAQACSILTDDAPSKNILVTIANQPLCNRALKEGDEYWSPGTLAFIGGSQSHTALSDWLSQIAKDNPGPQKVAVLTGPEGNANSINTDAAIKDIEAKYPDFYFLATVRTDYTVLGGNQKTLPLLQANPDLTVLIANYSDITRGAVQAVAQAGMAGKLKIYDSGGNKWAFDAVRKGLITSTRTLTPYTESAKAVESLAAAWKGETLPRFIGLDSTLITRDNIDKFQPEY
jgi:ribose transport system substrate-binding protein